MVSWWFGWGITSNLPLVEQTRWGGILLKDRDRERDLDRLLDGETNLLLPSDRSCDGTAASASFNRLRVSCSKPSKRPNCYIGWWRSPSRIHKDVPSEAVWPRWSLWRGLQRRGVSAKKTRVRRWPYTTSKSVRSQLPEETLKWPRWGTAKRSFLQPSNMARTDPPNPKSRSACVWVCDEALENRWKNLAVPNTNPNFEPNMQYILLQQP